jgi:ketosteroid isomerase-like protein
MSQANIDLVHRAWAAYNRGDFEAFRACLTDDWREYGAGGPDAGFGTLEPTAKRVVVHEMMFNRVRGGRLAETCTMTEGDGFYRQIAGREAPGHVDNIG